MKRIVWLAAGMLVALQGAWAGEIDAKVEAALAADIREEADRERDANRKPLETLQFFGLTDDMDVLELLPGRGWYTKVLAPVLAENGSLAVAIGTQFVAPRPGTGGLGRRDGRDGVLLSGRGESALRDGRTRLRRGAVRPRAHVPQPAQLRRGHAGGA